MKKHKLVGTYVSIYFLKNLFKRTCVKVIVESEIILQEFYRNC